MIEIKMSLSILICIFSAGIWSVQSAKVVMYPASINSHIIYYSKLGMGLADQGHEVILLLSSSIKISTPQYHSNISAGSFSYIIYEASLEKPFSNSEDMSKAFVDVAMAETPWQQFWKNFKLEVDTAESFQADCLDLMKNKEMIEKLLKSNFQFAVVDFIAAECRYVLPLLFNVPYATYSIPWYAWLYRVPRLQSFTPFMGASNSNMMTFIERVSTFIREIIYMYFFENLHDFSQELLPSGSGKFNAIKLLEKANLWFFLEDLSVGWPNANMPNTISIGDIMVNNDIKPLPDTLEEFIVGQDTAIVSLGSFFDHIPDSVIKRFCESFKHFSGKIKFIWKLKKPLKESCPGADNIMIIHWLPQNDLLAHPSVKFFITHGGLNSIIESVNHKKPMIIIPIALDQPGNSAMACSKGYAISLHLASFTVDNMINAIADILHDPNYQSKVEFYSSILNDKPDKPEERASQMINHVLKYGDAHLRTSAFHLTPLQFVMVDVVAFLIVILIIFATIVFCLMKYIFNLVRSKFVNTFQRNIDKKIL